MADEGRIRKQRQRNRLRKVKPEFVNPYPWMSQPEAMIKLDLERRKVPFSWRYFDGVSPQLTELMPGYHPEFTLTEYKVVIILLGNFFGFLPGPLDTVALAQTLLELDGWKVKVFVEDDVRKDISGLIDRELPELINGIYRGKEKIGPYGRPDLLAERRNQLRELGASRAKRLRGGAEREPGRRGRRGRRRRARNLIRSLG